MFPLSLQSYTLVQSLTTSSYKATVYKALSDEIQVPSSSLKEKDLILGLTGESEKKYIAIKTVPIYMAFSQFSLVREAQIHSEMDHKNIIKYIEFMEEAPLLPLADQFSHKKSSSPSFSKKVMFIAMEYASNGDLFSFLQQACPSSSLIGLPIKLIRSIFSRILRGVEFIHKKNYTHRDLKLENILLDHNFTPKVGDFGCSAPYNANENGRPGLSSLKGTEFYIAPEVWLVQNMIGNQIGTYDGEKIDVFSLGVILFALAVNGLPFKKATTRDSNYRLAATNKWEDFWEIFDKKVN